MENKTQIIISWIGGHEYFKWAKMCGDLGIDPGNFHRTINSKTQSHKIKDEQADKIIEVMRGYGYRDAEDKADEKMEGINEIVITGERPDGLTIGEFGSVVTNKKERKVKIVDLSTPSKGKTKDLNEKKTTNYPVNTTGKGVKKESDYLASRRKLKS